MIEISTAIPQLRPFSTTLLFSKAQPNPYYTSLTNHPTNQSTSTPSPAISNLKQLFFSPSSPLYLPNQLAMYPTSRDSLHSFLNHTDIHSMESLHKSRFGDGWMMMMMDDDDGWMDGWIEGFYLR
jgi:hypothetical protein